MAAADYNPLDNNAYQRSPYGTNDPNYHESAGYIAPLPRKKPLSKWIKIGVPLLVIVIAAAVVGGIVGSRKSKDASASSSNGGSSGSAGDTAAASSAISAKMSNGRFATATDSEFMVPVYPSTVSLPFPFVFQTLYIDMNVRPMLLFSPLPHSFQVPMQTLPGRQTLSSQPIPAPPTCAQTAPASSPLPTSGQPYQI
jgi:hypothetical protein